MSRSNRLSLFSAWGCHAPVTALAAVCLLTSAAASGQTSPARGALTAAPASVLSDDIPLADYLALLRQIAPAAEEGARSYLTAFGRRCGRSLSARELRRAMSQGDGDPVLMALIRASHLKDSAARERLATLVQCPAGARR